MHQVSIVGAGPGDPELITLKGKRLLKEADVVIYAGSLVNPELLNDCKSSCRIFDSAGMYLEEVLGIIEKAVSDQEKVVRLHTGDPSIYGAIQEQMDALKELKIDFEVVPGVSSFSGAAAAIQREFTLPGVSQTVILTRMEGRTPVPEMEKLELLASHQSSMAIFLSVGMMDKVVEKLKSAYPSKTPVAVIEKATWPQERIVKGSLETIAHKVKEAGIKKTAQILVGDFIETDYEKSKLYDKSFSHGFRKKGDGQV